MTANVRMRLVKGTNTFAQAHGHDSSESTAFNHLLHRRVKRSVTKNKTQHDTSSERASERIELFTASERFGSRFFQKQIVANIQGADRMAVVMGILSADREKPATVAARECTRSAAAVIS
jgi:hypothetical protein